MALMRSPVFELRRVAYYLLLSLLSISMIFPPSVNSVIAFLPKIEATVLGVDTSGMTGDEVKVFVLVKPYYAIVDRLTLKLSRVDYLGRKYLEVSKSYPGYVVRALATFHEVLTMTAPSKPGTYTYVLEVYYTVGSKTVRSSQVFFKLTIRGKTSQEKTSTSSITTTKSGDTSSTATTSSQITITNTIERIRVETKTVTISTTETQEVTVTKEREIESYGGFLGGLSLGVTIGVIAMGALLILLRKRNESARGFSQTQEQSDHK
ncbi:MAG: hypothetical protein J7L91_04575 [Candidatus Korarchaeota archaeon]|nr:hypothetical protein [Candidatus Korarchaeota archaeon]